MYVPESTKPYLRRLLFTLITDKISDFRAISVTERSCPAHASLTPFSKVSVTYRIGFVPHLCEQLYGPLRKWISRCENWNPLRRKWMFRSKVQTPSVDRFWTMFRVCKKLIPVLCYLYSNYTEQFFVLAWKSYPELSENINKLWY